MILDTNALSAWAQGNAGVEAPLRSAELLVVPSVVLGEYYFGIRQSRHRRRYQDWLARYLPLTEIALLGDSGCLCRYSVGILGSPIPPNDVWIAALARHARYAGWNCNDSHFDAVDRIQRLRYGAAE